MSADFQVMQGPTYPREGGAGNGNVGARAELLAGHEGRVGLARRLHVGAAVLVDVTEGRVERDEREEDVPEGCVLQEAHFLRQLVGPRCEAHLDLKSIIDRSVVQQNFTTKYV